MTAQCPVAPPESLLPAAADPTTTILMWVQHLRRTYLVHGTKFMFAAAAITAITGAINATAEFNFRFLAFPLFYCAIAVLQLSPLGPGRWALKTDALQVLPWRPAPARVLRGRRATAALEVVVDGEPVVLDARIDPAHLAMVTDTVWLVPVEGPAFLLRVPGSRELFPARRGKPVEATAVAPVEVTERWALSLRGTLLSVAGQFGWGAGLAAVLGAVLLGPVAAALTLLSVVVIAVPVLALTLRHRLSDFRLPGLVRTADWVRAEAQLSPWRSRRDGTASATATLTLPDGTIRTATMPAATVDLLGAVFDSSTLWIGGTTGRVAVGFPGYPHVAVADLTSP
ncbi:hypothetical protein [Actinokineospora diospyrosa]|uniref:DUF58 domain-containing protein n=1 Tax=Actinokineospora diospyrosa TaxID=103728 RepID=A0ABT1IB94_9PSEU|nr:hypothetical protein [Actinokineospora diospyrosa]MCP2269887.1 hypothetical protein [Actinokineospora diospyrosa]